jgi:hypothetical protein
MGYPIDTIKVRMQTNMYPNFTRCVIDTAKNEGIVGFYRGVPMPFATLVIKRSLQFRIYEETKKYTNPWLSGTAASLISPISNPMHVIKVRMQDSNNSKYKNIFGCIKDIYATDGVKGFFRGTSVNFIKDIMFGTVYLGSYGTFKSYLDRTEFIASKEIRNFVAGGSAGSFAWLVLMPIDFSKTAYQTGRGKEFIIQQVRKNGIRTLWKGGVPTIARIFPINACAMTMYELTKTIIDNKN